MSSLKKMGGGIVWCKKDRSTLDISIKISLLLLLLIIEDLLLLFIITIIIIKATLMSGKKILLYNIYFYPLAFTLIGRNI